MGKDETDRERSLDVRQNTHGSFHGSVWLLGCVLGSGDCLVLAWMDQDWQQKREEYLGWCVIATTESRRVALTRVVG